MSSSIINKTIQIRHIILWVVLLFISFEPSVAQVKNNSKLLHCFSIDFSNDVYFPEKVIRHNGPLYFKPFTKYSYSINIEYTLITKVGLGLQAGLSHGFIPFGSWSNSHDVFDDNSIVNGEKGIPVVQFKHNSLNVPYLDFPIKMNYLQPLTKKLLLNFKGGISLKTYPNYGVSGTFYGDQNWSVVYAYYEGEIYRKYQHFYPDLLLGLDFLWQPKKPNHFIKFGIKYSHSFVRRFYGNYWFANMGKQYDSSGEIYWGANYIGIGIGYHFMKYNRWQENRKVKEDRYLFNPMF